METILEVAKKLGIDPVYLGYLLGKLGIPVGKDGAVALANVLQRLLQDPDLLGGEVPLAEESVPTPPKKSSSVCAPPKKEERDSRRKKLYGKLLEFLDSVGIKHAWRPAQRSRARATLLLGEKPTEAYVTTRKDRRNFCATIILPVEIKCEFVIMILYKKSMVTPRFYLYTVQELAQESWIGCQVARKASAEETPRREFNVPKTKEYLLENRLSLLRKPGNDRPPPWKVPEKSALPSDKPPEQIPLPLEEDEDEDGSEEVAIPEFSPTRRRVRPTVAHQALVDALSAGGIESTWQNSQTHATSEPWLLLGNNTVAYVASRGYTTKAPRTAGVNIPNKGKTDYLILITYSKSNRGKPVFHLYSKQELQQWQKQAPAAAARGYETYSVERKKEFLLESRFEVLK